MGQKVDPRGFRIWVTKLWPCEWFAKTKAQSASFFVEDIKIRNFIDATYKRSWIWKVVIRKTDKEWEIVIFTAKPALIIGKEWKKLEEFQTTLSKKFGKDFKVVVKEIRLPELSARIMSEFACEQLEKRMPYRRVAKTVMQKVMEKWAIWVKVSIGWRLGWVDLSRNEKFIEWRLPLQTLRADIDYHYTTALTKYGILWVKLWIYKWDVHTVNKIKKAEKSNEGFVKFERTESKSDAPKKKPAAPRAKKPTVKKEKAEGQE